MEEQAGRAYRNDRQQQQEQKQHDNLNRGPLTGIRIKPFGSIPTRESGFEDLDGFWSPSAIDHSTPATEKLVRRVHQAKEKEFRKENKKRDLEKQLEKDVGERITIHMQSTVQGTPIFSPSSVGVEEASPPTTTPKWRSAGETSVLTPVSLGSYTTPKRIDAANNITTNTGESDDDNTAVDFTGDVVVVTSENRDKRSVEKLSVPRASAPSPARLSHDAVHPSSSELIYRSKQVADAGTNPHVDRSLAYSPEADNDDDEDDDQAGALDDLLASSKRARERQLSLANKLKTPSPSGFTTASEISKTPKSVSFADRIETTFENSVADDTEDVEIGKNDKDGNSGEQLVEDYANEGATNSLESSSIKEKNAINKEHIATVADHHRDTHFDVDDGNDSDGDGPGFQMMQEGNDDTHEGSKAAGSDMEESDVESASNHSAKKLKKMNPQKSVKKKSAVTHKGKQKQINNQKNANDMKSIKRKVHVVEEDNQEQTPGQGDAPKQQLYKVISVDHYKDNHSEDEELGLRRSKRAKFPPLKWWKNERLIFESGDKRESFAGLSLQADIDMPVVTKVVAALPTPAKPRSTTKNMQNSSKKSEGRKRSDSDSDSVDKRSAHPNQVPYDSTRLRSKYNILEGNEALVWDEQSGDLKEKKLVSYCSQMVETRLPKTVSRGKKESDVVGLASQAFNVASIGENIPGWISGHLLLPPRAIKDAEGVGLCSQVFFIGDCQPGSIEFSLANPEENEYLPATAQRFLLSKGDFFHVPPGNVYRLENHSRTTECKVNWTIIRSF